MSTTPYPVWGEGEDAVESALLLATFAHHGQVDKSGRPYIEHPSVVATLALGIGLGASRGGRDLDMGVVRQVAWLHDVAEDTRVSHAMMEALGVPSQVRIPLMLLDRGWSTRGGIADYYARIKDHPVALIVKHADISHNMAPGRLARLDEPTRDRLRAKYARACEALGLDFDRLAV